MSMSLEQIRTVVENFINETHNQLLVIKGDWGVGKTYFWDSLIAKSRTNGVVGRDYYAKVSLFGLNSLDELKSAIAVSRVEVRSTPKLDAINTNIAKILTRLEKIPALDKYLGGSMATLLHSLVTDTLVCFDDIERKGSGLAIRDVLGLASLLKEQRNCNVVLIVNDNELGAESEEFKVHGEKIIDRQLTFVLTPEESFECVFKSGQPHYDLIKSSVLSLTIPNIRILQRIQRFIEDISPYLSGTEKRTSEDVIRSLILFVWSYYGVANGAPDLKFVLNYSTVNSWLKREKNIPETENEKKWSKVLGSYNYFRTEEIDECLSQFVETGYINKKEFPERLKKKNDLHKVQNRDESYREAWAPYSNSFDDNEEGFIEGLLKAFRANIEILTPRDLQSVVDLLRQLERAGDADALVDEYFERRNSASDIQALKRIDKSTFSDDIKDEYLIDKLREALKPAEKDTRTLAEVVRPMALTEGWSIDDVRHMNSFSVDDYYKFFKSESGERLYWCVKKCLDFAEHKGDNGTYESVGEKAKQALLKIAGESNFQRIRIKTIYKLEPPKAVATKP
jgi:hypothetical protein